MKILRWTVIALFLSITACTTLSQEPKPIKVIVFPGGFNWPIWAASEKGFFIANGVHPVVTPTPNSQTQMLGLIDGTYDLAMTAIDNTIAYKEGQSGTSANGSDLISVMGGDNGFLRLVSKKEIRSINSLKDKVVSVDSLSTGYAFVLLELLERDGLLLNRDYKVTPAGGVIARYTALIDGKHDATLLVSPFEVMAKAQGLNQLADASAVLGNYQGLVATVRSTWAMNNESIVVGYIRGYREGLEWLYQPQNKEEAIALFMKNVPNSSRQAAEFSYSVLLDPQHGFQKGAQIDMNGVKTVLALRSKYGVPKRELMNSENYYDSRYFTKATLN
ncbi:ABC transporter substrate-binding protein [Limnohabitans sp. Rim8]|uniref:ABC transporter substrate-binding protein n=1 Tax=Limnohabitans sp. Rim8 TaxID=1100718 RepID=UPI000D397AE6|nr:ABC transporter substrate-binding protein [Limnohabitans sp. Rim8]PUE56538.1 ABC transporter substrate-binding protein [Limnohabitans sp. Rim8]